MTTAATSTPPRRSVGRPRNEATRLQILAATLRLLETHSVQAITIEGIAREAGVGKATIYRWWDSKAMVVIDAFLEQHVAKVPMPPDLPPPLAIAQHLRSLVHEYSGWSGRIVAQIIAEGQSDPSVLEEFRTRFHAGRRTVVRDTLQAWASSANIPVPDDIELLSELLYAPLYMRMLVGNGPMDDAFAKAHITYVYRLLGAPVPEWASLGPIPVPAPARKRARKSRSRPAAAGPATS